MHLEIIILDRPVCLGENGIPDCLFDIPVNAFNFGFIEHMLVWILY